ncbi:MAG: hypothetical protein F9K29_16530 [Hyphomicrobiaceae bacterium]|nr:MAG: hypothetical protein F9K29_16530 [Hyphomicrobiaceae bacterium]
MSISTNRKQGGVGSVFAHTLTRWGSKRPRLEDVAPHSSRDADLLYRRMAALGLSVADVERVGRGIMQDLELTCTRCDVRNRCEGDFAAGAKLKAWKAYCPNTMSLDSLRRLKGRSLI